MAATITVNTNPVLPTGYLTGTASFNTTYYEPSASLELYFYATYPSLPAQGSSGYPPTPIGGSYAGDGIVIYNWPYSTQNGSYNYSIYLPSFVGAYAWQGTRSIPPNCNYIVMYVRYAGPSNYEGYCSPVITVQRAS